MSLPSTASLRSDEVALTRTKVILSGTSAVSVTIEEVPNPLRRDDRNPTFYRIVFDDSDGKAQNALCEAVATFLNRTSSANRQWALGDHAKIDDPLSLKEHLSRDLYITQPHKGSHLHAYYFPHHPRNPYSSIHYPVDLHGLGTISKWSAAASAA
jgi:hypothetical protein